MNTRTLIMLNVALLTAVGCGEKPLPPHEGTDVAAAQMTPASPAPAPTTPAPNDAAESQPVVVPPSAVPAAGAVLASSDAEVPGIRVELTQLQRASGGTLNMRFRLVNDSTESRSLSNWLDPEGWRTVAGVHLVDPINKRKYFVIRDSENKCVCSREIQDVEPGQHALFWAKFPAPPPEVSHLSVIVPHFIPMDDVPLQ